QRMQLFALRRLLRQAFHRAHRLALSLHGEHEAGAHRLTLDEHGACAAHAVLAAQVRSGEPAVLAQRVREAAPGLDLDVEGDAVDVQGNGNLVAHGLASRSFSRMRGGVTGISKNSIPKGESASTMAFTTAAGAPIAPPSPTPLAPVIVASEMVSRWWISIGGTSAAVGGR